MDNVTAVLKTRYEKAREEIADRFFHGEDPGGITEAAGTGDPHLHGEAVLAVDTSSGKRVYYKPRDCRSSLLLWELAQALFSMRMVPAQVTGDGYAFQEAVEASVPETAEEKKLYYERIGKLTALFYALGSTDMHRTNVLCVNASPVVIDTETLLCAKAEGVGGAGEFSAEYGEIFPEYRTSTGECMVLPRFYRLHQHSPLLPGGDCSPEGFEDDFILGFAEGYQRIVSEKETVFGILKRFFDAPFRYILRSTASYAVTRMKYEAAKSDADKEQALKGLEKGLSAEETGHWRKVLDWERDCIREGDIPYFFLTAGGKALWGDKDKEPLIPDYLELSPIESAKWRIGRMNEQDLEVQTAYIRASLRHIDEWEWDTREEASTSGASAAADNALEEELTAEEAIREVEEAIGQLWQERIPLSGGCMLWHMPMTGGTVGSLFGLKEGFSGIAVFVHAAAVSPLIGGEAGEKAKRMAKACFRDMTAFADYFLKTCPNPQEERTLSRRFNGGFDFQEGLSGLLWALSQYSGEESETVDRIRKGFQSRQIEDRYEEELQAFIRKTANNSGTDPERGQKSETAGLNGGTDSLYGGLAGRSAGQLYQAVLNHDRNKLKEAGCTLRQMADAKRIRGCYRVYPGNRKQYFLPSFLKGSTGIAYIMLRYAETVKISL